MLVFQEDHFSRSMNGGLDLIPLFHRQHLLFFIMSGCFLLKKMFFMKLLSNHELRKLILWKSKLLVNQHQAKLEIIADILLIAIMLSYQEECTRVIEALTHFTAKSYKNRGRKQFSILQQGTWCFVSLICSKMGYLSVFL